MTTGGQDPSQPPAPGWWLASDGRWYPPQQQPAYGAPPPPAPSKGGRGPLIALLVIGGLLLLCGGGTAFVVWKIVDTVDDVVDGVTVGEVECPTEDDVSDLIGYDVELVTSGSLIVAAGCTYTSNDTVGAGVQITSGVGVVGDEVLDELRTTAEQEGAEVSSIDVGDDGLSFGSDTRSEAATKADGNIVQVEIFSEGGEIIGDKEDEAVELLEDFVDLNY